jgi:hypothetical protein
MFKRSLDFLTESLIGLGKAYLELDGIGFDSFIIGLAVMGLIKIKAMIDM